MRTLYVDVETTGLKADTHGIIDIAYIIDDEQGHTLTKGSFKMNPMGYKKTVSPKALEVNRYQLEDIKTFPPAHLVVKEFYEAIRVHMNKEKFKVIAFNAKFDTEFLIALFDTLLPRTYYKTFDYKYVCPFELVKIFQYLGIINTGKSQNLETVAKHFNIDHIPHDSTSDIQATRELWLILSQSLLANKDAIKECL